MKWSFRLGRFLGIDVFLHWTFLLLLGFVFLLHFSKDRDLAEGLGAAGFVACLFLCVLLHEYGHALMARRYGIQTRDIILLPIGGVARLERMPEKPAQEFLVAIAGPAVNAGIALALAAVGAVAGQDLLMREASVGGGGFLTRLLWINVALVVFNLAPAFPMDGGRVLRAMLAAVMPYVRATRIAATIGQGMAILFCLIGLFAPQPMLLFIAIFVFLGAQAEADMVETSSVLRGVRVADAMIRRFRALRPEDSLGLAADELLAGSQHDFPVVADGMLAGMLTRADLVRGLSQRGRASSVGEAMIRDVLGVAEGDWVERVFPRMREKGAMTAPVLRGGALVGLLTVENVSELVMIRTALRGAAPPVIG